MTKMLNLRGFRGLLSHGLLAATAVLGTNALAEVPAKVTYNDHVLPIFRNACLNCHNPDKKKAGLDLSTYQGALAGSDNGKVLESGNSGNSLLLKCVKQTEDPKMPPKGDKLTDNELAIIDKWIAGQLLETTNSKGIVASNNVQLAVVSLEKPAGPPPMPGDLPLEPFVRAKAGNALVALAASPWAPLVAVGGQKQIVLYSTESLQPLGVLPFPEGFPAIIRFSRNGQLLLTGGGLGGKSGQVALWDVQTGERIGTVGNEVDQVLGADLSPDQGHVALGGPTKVLKIYETKSGKLEHSIKKHTDWITAVAFSPDGKYLASADRSGAIVVWEGTTGKEFITLPGHKVMVTALAFMPGVLASASQDGTIVLWDVKEGKEIRKWNAHGGGVEWVDFTADGRVVSCGRDRLAKAWDQTGKNLFTSAEFGDIALRAVLTSDRVVAGDWTGAIRVFALEGAKKLGELTANPPPLAEQLTAAEKRVAEARTAFETVQQQLAALVEKRSGGAAVDLAQPPAAEASKPAETAKDQAAALAATLEQRNGELAKLREQRAKFQDGTSEYAVANEKVQGKKAEIAQTQHAIEAASNKVAAVPQPPTADQELTSAQAAVEKGKGEIAAATAELQRLQRAQSYMKVHTARQSYADKKARYEDLVATVKDAFVPIEQMTAQIAALEKETTESPAKLHDAEQGASTAKSALEQAQKTVSDAEAAVKEKATAVQSLTDSLEKSNTEMAPATKKMQEQEKQTAEAQKTVDGKTAALAELREARSKQAEGTPEYAAADAKVQAAKPPLAEATAKYDGLKGEIEKVKMSVDTATAQQNELKQGLDVAKAALPKAREALDQAQANIKTAAASAAAAERTAADLRKKSTAAQKQLVELRAKLPDASREAQLAKAAAEQEASVLGKQLDAVKAEAERAKAEFDSKYHPEVRAAAAAGQTSQPKS